MQILDAIFPRLRRRHVTMGDAYAFPWEGIGHLKFGEVIFMNIVEILTDLCNDVTWVNVSRRGTVKFAEFVRFFEDEGAKALWLTFRHGFAVIGLSETGAMRLLRPDEWRERSTADGLSVVESVSQRWQTYVMRSDTYAKIGRSDYDLLLPFIAFLDNTLNASNTSVERMGAMVVASPDSPSSAPTPAILNEKDKKDMEEEISKQYGLLHRQRQIMLLPQSMRFDTINLTGIDTRLSERVRVSVLAICDRVKVPANQVAIIDADSSKALSNGSELLAGDFAKYQSFERLLNRTFAKMARDLEMSVDYTIYNKPIRANETETATIETAAAAGE